eukprot:gnl/TRDRNA2_/TRDRNA2_178037_c0_seq1.p1 gnl/TRDRNA2_/TRDRNA2_178037_c0~~gnl/TRDRNA2_/TRDRNA2_178037_c0_seq1.p1  ORF type:complete len:1135 (-),score=16.38 gnl/TRDRNA2_/TRDRNA2_178037_c0_seq1:130-3534(-)
MFIAEIIIEGFKSYAGPIRLSGLDPKFNAITGLNGTGKSNILDSINFVLGISNLAQIRVSNLQELIHKQGHTGVTKAMVSIVFDNREKEPGKSPVGLEHFNEIIITRRIIIRGKNKFLINGKTSDMNQIMSFFHSVQLNVDNPHFMIMQGQISKVLNAKPIEILGLLEEATGTRIYETKKSVAQKMINKKQRKLEEIKKLLHNKIHPEMKKLENEKSTYQYWDKIRREVNKLKALIIAHEYMSLIYTIDQPKEIFYIKRRKKLELKEFIKLKARLHFNQVRNLNYIHTEKEIIRTEKSREIKTKENKLNNYIVTKKVEYSNVQSELISNRLIVEKSKTWLSQIDQTIIETRLTTVLWNYENRKKYFGGILANVIDDFREVKKKTVPKNSKTLYTFFRNTRKKYNLLIKKYTEKIFASVRDEIGKVNRIKIHSNKNLSEKRLDITKGEHKLAYLKYSKETFHKFEIFQKKIYIKIQHCKEDIEILNLKMKALDFEYSDPEPGFDRHRVKGLVAKLIQVREPRFFTPLEVVGGGKLYYVVVDTETTAKILLSKGKLRRRTTIIPLNKIDNRIHCNQMIEIVNKETQGKANLALNLIKFDDHVSNAIRYTFGNAFVCQDTITARTLALERKIRSRAVTINGDDFLPSGILTGGCRNPNFSILSTIHESRKIKCQLNHYKIKVFNITQKIGSIKALTILKGEKKEKFEIFKDLNKIQWYKKNFLKLMLVFDQMKENSSRFIVEPIKCMYYYDTRKKTNIILGFDRESKNTILNKVKQKLLNIETTICWTQTEVEAVISHSLQKKTEIEATLKTIDSLSKKKKEVQRDIIKIIEAINNEEDHHKINKKYISLCEYHIYEQKNECEKFNVRLSQNEIKYNQYEKGLIYLEEEQKNVLKKLDDLMKINQWVLQERKFFDQIDTIYEFTKNSIEIIRTTYVKKELENSKLEGKINKKVVDMFDKIQKEYYFLKHKKAVVNADKKKIELVIQELDENRKRTVKEAWIKVNKNLSSIFTTLNPGTSAELIEPLGQNFMDGLEIKISCSSTGNRSLNELSGGQKTLLALSLILALLMFKPSPIYILDEIDAALDPCHTLNVGKMIKDHFPQSQFILVSLKEDMYQNANALFRTENFDGTSTIRRL